MSNEQHDAYQVVFYRNGHDIETLYWVGSFEETQALARKIACKGGAEFRIFKQVYSERTRVGLAVEDGQDTV
jgi:hypothetical protein